MAQYESEYEGCYKTPDDELELSFIASALEVTDDFATLIKNKSTFIREAMKCVAFDSKKYELSLSLEADRGDFTVNVGKNIGTVRLGYFEVNDALRSALEKSDMRLFEALAALQLKQKVIEAINRVLEGDNADEDYQLDDRFDYRNFQHVAVLEKVKLPSDVYNALRKSSEKMKQRLLHHTLDDETASFIESISAPSRQFIQDVESLFVKHLETDDEQTAYFEPYLENGKFGLRKTKLLVSKVEISPRTPSSALMIVTDDEVALDYDALETVASRAAVIESFKDVYRFAIFLLLEEFPDYCVRQDEIVKPMLSVV